MLPISRENCILMQCPAIQFFEIGSSRDMVAFSKFWDFDFSGLCVSTDFSISLYTHFFTVSNYGGFFVYFRSERGNRTRNRK